MPLKSKRRDAQPGRINQELQQFADGLADTLVDQAKVIVQAGGAPWGATSLTEAEQLQRMDAFEEETDAVKKMTDGQLAAAAITAIRMRQKAMAEGKWKPPELTKPVSDPYVGAEPGPAPPAQVPGV